MNDYKMDKNQTRMLAEAWHKALPLLQERCREAMLVMQNLPETADLRLSQLIREVRDLELQTVQLMVVTSLHCKNKLEDK